MEALSILLPLVLVSGLAGWGSYAAWIRGYRKPVYAAILVILALVVLFLYLSSIATGQHLAGLGEMLVAFALLLGPGVGIILGIALAFKRTVGLVLGLIYVACLLNLFLVIA